MASEKGNLPMGALPYLEVNGKKYSESKAIASFVAKECGLAGKTNADAMRVDEVYCLVGGILEASVKFAFASDDAAKEAAKTALQEKIASTLGYLEGVLKENGSTGFFVGKELSMADLA